MINRTPLYQQLNSSLSKMIIEEKYTVGDKFLTERTICALFEVSRATANKALSSLVSAGILEFKKGVGTFIKSIPISNGKASSIFNFTEIAKQAGMILSWEIKSFDLIDGSGVKPEIAKQLNIHKDEQIYKIAQLMFADNNPMILNVHYIAAKYCPALKEQSIIDPLNDFLIEKYNLTVSSREDKIRAVNLNIEEAKLLDDKQGNACLEISSISFIESGLPLWWEKSIYKPEKFELTSVVDSKQMIQKLIGGIIF